MVLIYWINPVNKLGFCRVSSIETLYDFKIEIELKRSLAVLPAGTHGEKVFYNKEWPKKGA